MSRQEPRELIVIRKTLLTPHMLRITLGGQNIHTLPDNQAGAYVKLIFPRNALKPLVRTYTIRCHRVDEMDIDFVLHHDGGPASSWAEQANVGDTILIGGLGPKRDIESSSDWHIFVGDMTALPAISVNLENLPEDAKGYAILEVISEEDIQPLQHPKNVNIKWTINPHPGENSKALLSQVQALSWPQGSVSIWAACEFSSMKLLRDFFKSEKQVGKDNLYISSYWKLGVNEDQHKEAKRKDAETST